MKASRTSGHAKNAEPLRDPKVLDALKEPKVLDFLKVFDALKLAEEEKVCKKKLAEDEARAQRKELLAQSRVTTVMEGFKESLDTSVQNLHGPKCKRQRNPMFFFLSFFASRIQCSSNYCHVISMCFCFRQF